MKFRHGITGRRTENAINGTIVIAKSCQLHLDGLDRAAIGWVNVIIGAVVIVGIDVRVVIVWVIIVRIIWQIVPWEISGI